MTEPSSPQTEPERRQLAAILAADVVGYSRMMEADERNTLKRLRELRETLLQPKVIEHHGRIFKTMGDGFLVEFASVVDAVHCAVDIQRMMSARNTEVAEEGRLQLRIGVNLGDVFHEGDDVFGDGVNLAARLEGLADPGGICVSRAAHDQVRERLNFDFQDMGEHQVKNISRPIQVFRVQLDGAVNKAENVARPTVAAPRKQKRWSLIAGVGLLIAVVAGGIAWQAGWLRPAPVRPVPWSVEDRRMSFAILMIDAPQGDAGAMEYASALTDELITGIGQQRYAGIVVPRRTVAEISGAPAADSIGRRLNVAFVIEGKVRRVGNNFETQTTLANVATASAIGAETMVEPTNGNHDVYRSSLLALCVRLMESAQEAEVKRVRALPEEQRDARDLLHLSWPLIRRSKEALDQLVSIRERALTLAPNEPNILAALGTGLALRASGGWSTDKTADLKRANDLLDRALTADSDNLYAMQGKEMYYVARREWEQALIQERRILTINPTWIREYGTQAQTLLALGRPEEALAALDRQPIVKANITTEWEHTFRGRLYFALGRYAEAAERFRAAIVASPPGGHHDWAEMQLHLSLAASDALLGNDSAAAKDLAEFRALAPSAKRLSDIPWDEFLLAPPVIERLKTGLRKAGLPD